MMELLCNVCPDWFRFSLSMLGQLFLLVLDAVQLSPLCLWAVVMMRNRGNQVFL